MSDERSVRRMSLLHRVVVAIVWAAAIAVPATVLLLLLAQPDLLFAAFVFAMYGVVVTSWAMTGAFLITRVPGNRVGWLLWVTATGMGLSLAGQAWASLSSEPSGPTPPMAEVGVALGLLFLPAVSLIVLLPMIFPDGRFLSRRWAFVGALTVIVICLLLTATVVRPGEIDVMDGVENPFGVPALAGVSELILTVVNLYLPIALALGIAAALLRYRRGSALERGQLKWFGAIVGLSLSGFLTATLAPDPLGQWAWVVASLSLGLVPIAIGIAVLRYRLYEIDRLISRTIGWALVTALLVGAFLLLVLASTELLQPLTGGSTLAVAGSTLIVVALFAPLRGRVQRAVDRRFDRARYDGERLLAAFGLRVRDEVDLETIRADVLATVDAAVRPAHVGLWLAKRRGSE